MALGDYPVNFDFFTQVSASFATDIFVHEDGTEKRIALMALPDRVFKGEHVALTETEKTTLLDFFNTQTGQLTEFDLIEPITSATFSVRFLDADLDFRRRPDTLWNLTVNLKEVL